MPMYKGAGRSPMDYKKDYRGGRGGSMSHKSNPSALPSGRNPGQKMASDIPHNFAPGPGSPVPTDSNAR